MTRTMKTGWALSLLALLIALAPAAASAAAKHLGKSKVSADLLRLYEERQAQRLWSGPGPFVSGNRLARVAGDRVVIDAIADGDPAALEAQLVALGMTRAARFGRVVSGRFPVDSIPALASVPRLAQARPSYAVRRAGAVTSQGDVAERSDVARVQFGVSGAGVRVGVLSDSYNCLGGAPQDQATGDLPAEVQVFETSDCAGATDEGRAMLQIVHDVAPGAALSFANTDGMATFALNILNLQESGSRVIVDDILFLAEPMFQDGIIAQAVDAVRARGAAYFSAAGNDARDSYESAFRPGPTFDEDAFPVALGAQVPPFFKFFGGVAHNFAGSEPADHLQRVTLPAGATLVVILQWDSPFRSAGGPGTPNDVDIYVLNEAGTEIVGGTALEDVGGDAVELMEFTNTTGSTAAFNLMIVNFDGPLPGYVKYVYFTIGGNATIDEYATQSATNYGHSNAAGAIAVGAVNYQDSPAFGVTPPVLAPYSSAGGTPILFDPLGNRLAVPIIRRKPDITAPDGVTTTFFPSPSNPQFFGTSAAAPHAAAVAALMLERHPDLTPTEIGAALQATAIPMGSPVLLAATSQQTRSLPADFNFDSGNGFIQADAALALLSTRVAGVAATLPTSRAAQVGHTVTGFAAVINTGAAPAEFVSIQPAFDLPGTFTYHTADGSNNLTGTPNTPVTIAPGGTQNFVIAFTPSAPFSATVPLAVAGANLVPVVPVAGLNTWRLVATVNPGPDVIALAGTATPGLIVDIPGPEGTGAFAVATANVGAAGTITVSGNPNGLPVAVFVCRTDAGPCVPEPSVSIDIEPGQTPTFSFFVQGQGTPIPFDPAHGRVFAVITNAATGDVVGETSVAVRTAP